ncbi:hypothetical protein ACFV4K_24035 [Nocardia sp. NPDC059764]|uniref:hypothetical protein n=1 Tax=Nocardia sp. NPDC059764 TaxID=3346939 RepID=UPI00365ABB96
MSPQTVVFRFCPGGGPKWQYYSMPESVLGGAETLSDAKRDYREALAFMLEVEPDALPEIREHTERPIVPGVYLRTALDEHYADRAEAFDVLVPGFGLEHTAEVRKLFSHTTASGDVVAVVCEPTDDVGFLLEQITPHDAVWMVLNGPGLVAWRAIGGVLAANPTDVDARSLTDLGVRSVTSVMDFVTTLGLNRQRYAVAVGV